MPQTEGQAVRAPSTSALAEFLRARRASVSPEAVGLGDDGHLRRVPGLRREELAQLAHVSVDYIVRLEQGRTRRVSSTVLESLADALLLDADERAYLHTVAEPAKPSPRRSTLPGVAPQLRQLLDSMHDVPAMVLHRRMDVLAWNRGAAALLTDFGALPAAHRNLVWLTFLDPSFRALYADWPTVAKECVAVLRMEAGLRPDDPEFARLIGELSIHDADFRTWWASYQVQGPRRLTKAYQHPVVGTLVLDVQQFTVDTHPDQLLVAYTAAPDTPAAESLQFLLQWAANT